MTHNLRGVLDAMSIKTPVFYSLSSTFTLLKNNKYNNGRRWTQRFLSTS
jgi:hypothetical protein